MIKQNQKWLNILNLLSDALLTFVSWFIACWIRYDLMGGYAIVDYTSGSYILILTAYCMTIVVFYYMLLVYSPKRYKQVGSEALPILFANAVCTLALMAVLYLIHSVDVSRIAILLFYLISSFLVIGKHLAERIFLHYIRRGGFNLKHILVVGDGRLAAQYTRNVEKNPQMGFCIDGYIAQNTPPYPKKLLGSYADLERVLQSRDIDELVIALDSYDERLMNKAVLAANKEGVRVSVIPTYNNFIPPNPSIDIIGDTSLIDLSSCPLDNIVMAGMKRLMDIVGSALAITLLSPVMLAVAIGVKLSSPGPVFFVQERVGRKKKIFKMLKFRSMRVNDREETGWSTAADPRKTAFGSFIRKTSIDELPQLFNVFVGQMSLVGPRPEIPYHVNHFKEEIPQYLVRQQVRPGMTGWAQVNGLRGDTSIEERVRLDLWYINHWCLRLDMLILLRTAFGGFMNQEKMGALK
ncbi:MAG: undecaprenyl-phosphate glucose phosphotransferase [Eubacteriales bacterium]|nr:undecaprenyl-phosphate glucose phosphotransferase [Eubacteriales bacterium]